MTLEFKIYGNDPRTPLIPSDQFAKLAMDQRTAYPVVHETFHYKHSTIRTANEYSVLKTTIKIDGLEMKEKLLKPLLTDYLLHTLERIEISVDGVFRIELASVLITKKMSITAQILEIIDDPKSASDPLLPIRTTIVARESLNIKAKVLIVDGADIIESPHHSIDVQQLSCRNTSYNTQWLEALAPSINDKNKRQPLD